MRKYLIMIGFVFVASLVAATFLLQQHGGSNSPKANLKPFMPAAHGMLQDGPLWTSCRLTYTDGVPTGANLAFYNPSKTASVRVSALGVELISFGVLAQELPIQTSPFTVAPQIEQPEPVTLYGADEASSCRAGWNP